MTRSKFAELTGNSILKMGTLRIYTSRFGDSPLDMYLYFLEDGRVKLQLCDVQPDEEFGNPYYMTDEDLQRYIEVIKDPSRDGDIKYFLACLGLDDEEPLEDHFIIC